MKSTDDDDLKLRPTKVSKCVSTFRKNNSTTIHLSVDGICTADSSDVAEAFAKHFYTTFNHISPLSSPVTVSCSHFLPLISLNEYDIQKAIKRFRQSKYNMDLLQKYV